MLHYSNLSPRILFEDTHLIVLSKPAGLLSQGEISGQPNLVDWLRQYLGRNYVGLIHRLDRNTSGIMVVAKRTKSAQRLSQALQSGRLHRSYLGWVVGTLNQAVEWKHDLIKSPETNTVRVIPLGTQSQPGAKKAILQGRPLALGTLHGNSITLMEFQLETGRSHQIRAQTAFEGIPLLGDRKYARKNPLVPFARVALHSFSLEFPHPMTQKVLKFQDPLPADLAPSNENGTSEIRIIKKY